MISTQIDEARSGVGADPCRRERTPPCGEIVATLRRCRRPRRAATQNVRDENERGAEYGEPVCKASRGRMLPPTGVWKKNQPTRRPWPTWLRHLRCEVSVERTGDRSLAVHLDIALV